MAVLIVSFETPCRTWWQKLIGYARVYAAAVLNREPQTGRGEPAGFSPGICICACHLTARRCLLVKGAAGR